MKFNELLGDAMKELQEEKRQAGIDMLKERLREIEEAKAVLSELEEKFQGLLDECVG